MPHSPARTGLRGSIEEAKTNAIDQPVAVQARRVAQEAQKAKRAQQEAEARARRRAEAASGVQKHAASDAGSGTGAGAGAGAKAQPVAKPRRKTKKATAAVLEAQRVQAIVDKHVATLAELKTVRW